MATTLDLMPVPTYNIASLGIADISVYATTPSNPSLEITVPGFPKVNVEFTPSSVNIYNAAHFDIDCEATSPLPDGIYYLKYSVTPNSTTYVEKSFLRMEQLICRYYNVRLSLDVNCPCSDEKDKHEALLRQASILMEGAQASANQCDPVSAYEKYQKADKILRNITSCDC